MTATAGRPSGDSGGITGGMTAVELPPRQLAAHPANPREDLGDLAELEASIRELGVLEPLVVVTAAAHQAGGWPGTAATATHVLLAGHRRHAAAIAAGLTTVPCVVRDDLAGDDALAVMLSENDPAKRKALSPLAEARAFAELAARGWSQRRIAQRMGCKQPQVSKRLALLRLPGQAIEALAAGWITPADAGELAKLAAHPEHAVKALGEIGSAAWDNAARVVARHLEQIEREKTAAATRAKLEADGVKVVDPGQLGPYGYAKRLHDGTDLAPHRAAGCLVGAPSSYRGEPEYYCRDPSSHEGTPAALPGWSSTYGTFSARDERRAAEDRARQQAARARKHAAAKLAARPVTAAQAADVVSRAVINRHVDAACLKTAAGWLRDAGIGPAYGDVYSYADHVLASGNAADIRRLAAAMSLAADEQATGNDYSGQWADRQIGYLGRLVAEAGYQPTEWETSKLTEARARVHARATLSCPDCGCTYARPCGASSWDRCDAEPAAGGTWRYRCKAKHPGSDGAVHEAWNSLLLALEPAAAGARLPDELAAAIEPSRASISDRLYEAEPGDMPTSELLEAARAVHAAALPHAEIWTEKLRAAFTALGLSGGDVKPAADSAEDPAGRPGADDLYDALEDLLIAVDPTTVAGNELPDGLAGAIEDARVRFTKLYDRQAGDQPAHELIAAASALHQAALPHEQNWTPQLRAALGKFAAAASRYGQIATTHENGDAGA
jgi:ParB/RepB/Spo0J family partition protein